MKRIFGAIAVLVVAVGLFPAHSANAASTNNFRITSYDIQYELSRDSESRSVLKATETIVAEFPAVNQNHGIERAIPSSYDGHDTSLSIKEVTNRAGKQWNYSTYSDNGNTVLRVGDADTYVHGSQTYHIVYTQRDVTKAFENTGRDEWYWDTNGTEWKVPIDTLRVSVKIDPSLTSAQTGTPACYQGVVNVTDSCVLTQDEDGAYTTEASNLHRYENVTVAFGFQKGTFAGYVMSPWAILVMIWGIMQFLMFPIAIVLLVILSVQLGRRTYRKREENPIVAEYIPPKDASVMVSSQVIGAVTSTFTAQLIDLAVRHYIAIVETRPKSTWRAAQYDIVVQKNISELRSEEQEIITDMFGHVPVINERLSLTKLMKDTKYSMRTLDNDKKLKVLLDTTYGIREKSPKVSKYFYKWAITLLILGIVTLSIPLLFVALFAVTYGAVIRPLTDKGLELRRYVLGLQRYIRASETERLAFLQGPDTAQKVGYDVDPSNPGQMVKLYERVLPYAILLGAEKEWSKRLGDYYQQTQASPDWYTGTTAFNAAVFTSTLHNFSQASSYSAGSSSSSGGSSGGGFSGGGGGGGGGGGW
jgi:uncharacterized membrane protein YgcG